MEPQGTTHTPRKRNLGPGVQVNLELANYSLTKTMEALFGRVNYEMVTVYDSLPLIQEYKERVFAEVSNLFKTAQEEFEAALRGLPQINGPKIEPRIIPVEIHTRHAGQFLEVVRAADRVLTALRRAWICGQLPEENYQAQSRQVRGQLHHLAGAVDALFRACLERRTKSPGDGNGGGVTETEESDKP